LTRDEIKEIHRCKWLSGNYECGRAGSISPDMPMIEIKNGISKNAAPFYCSFHYACLRGLMKDTPDNERDYWLDYEQKEKDCRKVDPDQVSRFLISMGSKSLFWQKASPEKQKAAIDYYKNHKTEIDEKINLTQNKSKSGEPTSVREMLIC